MFWTIGEIIFWCAVWMFGIVIIGGCLCAPLALAISDDEDKKNKAESEARRKENEALATHSPSWQAYVKSMREFRERYPRL